MTEAATVARDLAAYAKQFSAGAFATPIAKEIAANPGMIQLWDDGNVIAVSKRLTRHSTRKDYTGREYVLPSGSLIITHLAVKARATLPDLGEFDYIYSYVEDGNTREQLQAQNRVIVATKVTAASELIHCWGRPGEAWTYQDYDMKTFTRIPDLKPPIIHMQRELGHVENWYDDFPFYSDGSWSAVSLRGYKPDDPQWGVKPSEMPKSWLLEHPEAVDLVLGWTTMATRTPVIRSWVESISGWENLERVRLFKMTARPSLNGNLRRHSDIQDKSAGTNIGQLARFHVPLLTHPDVKMTCWKSCGTQVQSHMSVGDVFYLDVRKPHAVANKSPVDRVHLVVDVVINQNTQQMISKSIEVNND